MTDFLKELQELYDKINEHQLENVKQYIQMYCKLDIIDIHRYYREHFLNMDNENEIKQEIDTLLSLLGIPYIKIPNK